MPYANYIPLYHITLLMYDIYPNYTIYIVDTSPVYLIPTICIHIISQKISWDIIASSNQHHHGISRETYTYTICQYMPIIRIWINGHDSGTDWLEVPTIYKAYFLGLVFRGYPHNSFGLIWYSTSNLVSWNSHWMNEISYLANIGIWICKYMDDIGNMSPIQISSISCFIINVMI